MTSTNLHQRLSGLQTPAKLALISRHEHQSREVICGGGVNSQPTSLSDAGGTALLAQICHAQDRVEQLASQIAIDGVVIYTKTGPKAHPAMRDELANRAFIVRGLQNDAALQVA